MSYYKTLETKGKRKQKELLFESVSCPNNMQYWATIGDFMTANHIVMFTTAGKFADVKVADYDEANKQFGATADTASNILLTGTTSTFTNTTPVRMYNNSCKVRIRNNYKTVAKVSIVNWGAKSVVPYTWPSILGSGSMTANMIPLMAVVEGIADLGNLTDLYSSGSLQVFKNNFGGTSYTIHDTDYWDIGFTPCWKLEDGKAVYSDLFKVIEKHDVTLKPGDSIDFFWKLPDIDFPDGMNEYLAGAMAYEFTRWLSIGVQGDLGHTRSIVRSDFPVTGAASDVTNGTKGANTIPVLTEASIDVMMKYEYNFELFDATLFTPGQDIVIGSAHDKDNLNDVTYQSNIDIE